MTVPLVATHALSAGYHGVAMVRDLELEVRPGEIVALLGPNGAGKSTTMMALAGELEPLGGEIELFGSSARGRLNHRALSGLAFLPEGRSVFRLLTARDNLRLGRGSVEAAVELGPEIEPLLGRRAGLLSGGEQQILALARALAGEPRLLLADELSLGLAPRIVDRMLAAIRRAADTGLGALLVEQHAHQALRVADRGYVLRRGQVVMTGTSAELASDIDELTSSYLSS